MATRRIEQQPLDLPNITDDCLLEIFGHLELTDLRNIAGVSTRFKALSGRVFSSKWKELSLTLRNMSDTAIAIDYLRKFGPHIETLCLVTTEGLSATTYNIIFNVLVTYCSGLTCLEMRGFTFDKIAAQEAQPVFARVKRLILKKCVISVEWIQMCPELVELELIATHVTYNGARNLACPKLEVLKIKGSHTWVRNGLDLFLQKNRQIKTFEALPLPDANSDYAPYEWILNYVPSSIECLATIALGITKSTHFASLKRLRIKDVDHSDRLLISPLISATLEYLEIYFEFVSEKTANEISKLRNLNSLVLHVEGGCESANLFKIIRNIGTLTELVLSTAFNHTINEANLFNIIHHGQNLRRIGLSFLGVSYAYWLNAETYRIMLNIVLRRQNGKSLHIVICAPQQVLRYFNVQYPMQQMLTITCLSIETVAAALNMKLIENQNRFKFFKMTQKMLKEFSDRGLCPKMDL